MSFAFVCSGVDEWVST